MPKQYYYAVRIGRIPGIYMSWNECEKQGKNFPGTISLHPSTFTEQTTKISEIQISSFKSFCDM